MCLWDTIQARIGSVNCYTGTTAGAGETVTINANQERTKLIVFPPSVGTIAVSLVARTGTIVPIQTLNAASPNFLILDLKLHSRAICDQVRLVVSDAAAVYRADEEVLSANIDYIKEQAKWLEKH